MSPFTYPQVGATRDRPLPAGYRHLHLRTPISSAADSDRLLATAGDAVMSWQMHRRAGVAIEASADRAAPGVRVTVRLGVGKLRIAAPCEVIWTVDEPDRIGWGYGTLTGHPAIGEEAFVVDRTADGTVWLTVTSFSRPAHWTMRAAGPLAPMLQQAFARRCAQALRRLCHKG